VSDTVVEARWDDGLRFRAEGRSGVPIVLDGASEEGPSPPEALLMSLATCMGVDAVDILGKMRVELGGFSVRVEGDRRPEPPRRYLAVRMTFTAEGMPPGDRPKLERAVALSRERYCSVLHSLQPDLDLAIRIVID
jgi:putative redox protein